MKKIATRKMVKNQIVAAVAAALLALPFSSTLALAETTTPAATSVTSSTADTTNIDTTNIDTTSTDATSTDTTSTDTVSTDTTSTDTTGSVAAIQDDEDSDSTSVTDDEGNVIDPANWLSDLIGKLQLALTFDPARKSELNQHQALAKLAEAQKLMAEGKSEESEIAFTEYTDKITKAQEFLEQVKNPDSDEAKMLALALTNVNQNNVKVLGNLLEKLPPQAAQKLALNVVRSMEKAVTKMENQEDDKAVTDTETTENSTDSAVTPAADRKSLEKQAKAALKEFKKTLKQGGKIQLEDDQDDEDQDQDQSEDVSEGASDQDAALNDTQPTSVTVAPAQLQAHPNSDKTAKEKSNQIKHDDNGKDNGAEKKHDNNKQGDNK